MEGPFSTLLGPMLVLSIGAVILYMLDRLLEPQDQGVAEAVVLGLGLIFLVRARAAIDVPIDLGLGGPGMHPFLVLSHSTWRLSLLLLGCAFLVSLASLGQSTHGRWGRLAAVAAGLMFLSAGDWATLALAWMLIDASLALTLNAGLVPSMGQGPVRVLGWTTMLSMGGAALLAVALVWWQRAGTAVWVDRGGVLPVPEVVSSTLPSFGAGLLAWATLLRLMPFPLPAWHIAAEEQEGERHPLTQFLVLALPTLLGAYLWARLGDWMGEQAVPWLGLLALWGALVLLYGAFQAWGVQEPGRLVTSAHTAGGALVLVGIGVALQPTWLILLAVHIVLVGGTLFTSWTQCQHLRIFDVRTYWRTLPTLLAVLSAAGVLFTAGFPARVVIYWALFAARRWLPLLVLMGGEALFLGALLRVLLDLECVLDEQPTAGEPTSADPNRLLPPSLAWVRQVNWRREIGYAAGMLLALGILVIGIAPRLVANTGIVTWIRLPVLPVWAALLLAPVGAIMIYRTQDWVLEVAHAWGPLVRRLFSFEWLYAAVETVLDRVGGVIWGGTQVVEGVGYMAWVVLVCLVFLLFFISR